MWNQISSLFFVLLAMSVLLSFVLKEYTDSCIIATITLVNVGLGFYQEFKASRASQKLLKLVETKVYVFRQGALTQIPSSALVLGDCVHLMAGSIAPVDIHVEVSDNALLDESMRTGETAPKNITVGETLFSGEVVMSGKVVGKVIALGENSSIAKYRTKLEAVKKWSDFSVFVNNITKYIFITAISMLLVAFAVLVFILGRYDFAEFFIFSIALLVGVVPEALPLIITLILTRESVVLSQSKVIVKRLSSLQELGAVQFLLTDKTGTITENKLQVSAVYAGEDRDKSSTQKFWEISNSITEGDYERPLMDVAYDGAINTYGDKAKTVLRKITDFNQFKNDVGYETFVFEGGQQVARGIIGKVLELCANCIEDRVRDKIVQSAEAFESKGMRVIATVVKEGDVWKFSGYVAFHDPIKKSAAESFRIAHERGVSVKILTGDSEAVAQSVANELGLMHAPENIISFETIKVEDLTNHQLKTVVVFAKCTPEDKLVLIDRYLKLGPVAFLGDGTNDALALKRSDIGIAVDNASDIAKESADVILLEKDLGPILEGISIGRRSLRNVLTYIMYTLSGNAGTFFSLLVASFFYGTLPMLPIQILLNNLLTDLPLMLIITDNPDEYALKHVPHYEPRKIMKRVFIFGIISSLFDLIYFHVFAGASVHVFQTGWFIFSILTELALVFSIRSSRPLFKSSKISLPLLGGIIFSALLSFVFIYVPDLARPFQFVSLSVSMLLKLSFIVLIYTSVNEIAKYCMRKRNLYNKPATLHVKFKEYVSQ